MPDLIELLTFESHKLMMAASPHLKRRLKENIKKVFQEPALDQAAVIKATKEVLQQLEISLKSHPDAKNARVAVVIVYCLLLRSEARAMVHLSHESHGHPQLNLLVVHLNNAVGFASMIRPLLKGSDAHQIEALEEALRRIH